MVVGLATAVEGAVEALVLDTGPLLHDVPVGEIGEAVEVGDCQDHCTVSSAALVLDLAHVVGEGLGLEVVPVDHMGSVAEAVG